MPDGAIIALVLRENRVEWTAVQHRKHRTDISQQKSLDLAWPEGVSDHRSPEAAAYLKSLLPAFKGSVGIVVPADRVLMRVLELPSTDPEELQAMAELQVDKFSPFPTDQLALATEVLHQSEESSRVLVAAVQHEYIDHLGDFFLRAGLYPQTVDIDVLGWWTLIRDEGHVSGSGQEIILVHEDHCAQLVVCRDGIPLVIRALDPMLNIHRPGFAQDIAEEVEYTLMTMEGSWGTQPTTVLSLWSMGPAPSEVVEAMAAVLPFGVKNHDLAQLPPLSEGISRRLCAPAGHVLDLAPAGWRRGIQSRRYQRQAAVIAGVAFGLWFLLMGGLWLWAHQHNVRLAETQNAMARLQGEVQEVRELRGQVESLEQYADRTYSTLECLREICQLMPSGVEISSLTYTKSQQVNLRGEANADGPINEFIAKLEKSEVFTGVKTEGISTVMRAGRPRSQFRITMMLPSLETEDDS